MSKRNESGRLTAVAAAAIAKNLRVKFDGSGQVVVAGDENYIGTTEYGALAADEPVSIVGKHAGVTNIYTAGGAIAKGAAVTTAAGGKVVTGTGGAVDLGYANTASTADGDFIEVVEA